MLKRYCRRLFSLWLFLTLLTTASVSAYTDGIPEWYRLSAILAATPEVDRPIEVLASLTAITGDLQDVHIKLLLPPGWAPASPSEDLAILKAGQTRVFRFSIKAASPLPNASIGCCFTAKVPKTALAEKIRSMKLPEGELMIKAVERWSDLGTGYTDISFALFAEEGFFPIGNDMWTLYDDRLKPKGMLRGPSLYKNEVITIHQAEIDVQMYSRLQKELVANPSLAEQLKQSGVDIGRKQGDALNAFLVLGTDAFLRGEFPQVLSIMERLEAESKRCPPDHFIDLRIAAANLRALARWSNGDHREAETLLRDAFYQNRKNPVQRYVLRNLGLLMIDKGDKGTAREMFRLALEMKPSFTLLAQESAHIKK